MIAYALAGNPIPAAISMWSSSLPDRLEMVFGLRHRTITHWPYIPLALLLGCYWVAGHQRLSAVVYCALFVMVGYICHLFEDLLSKSGIPLGSPYGSPTGLDLYKTNTSSEPVALVSLVGLSLVVAYGKGFCGSEHLSHLPDIVLQTFAFFLGTPL